MRSPLKHKRTPKGQFKMDNPEKRATYGTKTKKKQNKYTTQHVSNTENTQHSMCRTPKIHKQTQIKQINKICLI
jgi:hypothetical protein